MRYRYILILAALLCGPAMADLVLTAGKSELRLLDSPCTHPAILEGIKAEYRSDFRRGYAALDTKVLQACWVDTMQGVYWISFESGESLALPVAAFTNEPGV